jgi:cytosine/adenosine deaminase-related metal-dependent hydrolase
VSGALLLTGVRPLGGPARDLLVADGKITRVGELLEAPEGATVVDGRGQLAVPGLVDAHAHLDKTLWGLPWRPHTAGDGLAALIDNEHRGRAELRRQGVTVARRAASLLAAYVAAGTSHIRSHVDVDTVAGLDSLHGVIEARDTFADRVDVELVAFPQSGLLVRPGTAELLEAAVHAGADLVGGLDPAGFDQRPVEHLDAVFAIADRNGCGVDIHLHDAGELGAFTIDLIVERTPRPRPGRQGDHQPRLRPGRGARATAGQAGRGAGRAARLADHRRPRATGCRCPCPGSARPG